MLRRRTHRLTTAFFVVLSLLFSQLALASYVCPRQGSAAAMAQTMASGQPCQGMDEAQPTLCHDHAAGAAQSFDAVKVPTPSLPMLVQMLAVAPVLEAAEAVAAPVIAIAGAPAPPDPLFLSTLRLRV